MSRPTTALTIFDIPERLRGPVRVHRPATGKASYRVIWTDDDGKQRERTFRDEASADQAAASIAEGLARSVPLEGRTALTLEHLLDRYLYGDGMSRNWRSEKSVRRPDRSRGAT